MEQFENLHVKTPWVKNLGGVPAYLEYYRGSMYDKVAEIAVNYPNYIAYDFMATRTLSARSMNVPEPWLPSVSRRARA